MNKFFFSAGIFILAITANAQNVSQVDQLGSNTVGLITQTSIGSFYSFSDLDQSGTNQAVVIQVGDNASVANQFGSNVAIVTQRGGQGLAGLAARNNSNILQNGANQTRVEQTGDGHNSDVNQFTPNILVFKANRADVLQIGDSQESIIDQMEEGNYAYHTQKGNDNFAVTNQVRTIAIAPLASNPLNFTQGSNIDQNGSFNYALTIQNGANQRSIVIQRGGANGFSNYSNESTVTQIGSLAFSQVIQGDTILGAGDANNTAIVNQINNLPGLIGPGPLGQVNNSLINQKGANTATVNQTAL